MPVRKSDFKDVCVTIQKGGLMFYNNKINQNDKFNGHDMEYIRERNELLNEKFQMLLERQNRIERSKGAPSCEISEACKKYVEEF